MTLPTSVGNQRRADHRDLVAAPTQQLVAQQHMGTPTTPTTRPPRAYPTRCTTRRPNRPGPSPTPRPQPLSAARTPDPARQQLDLDPSRVVTYHEHRCLRHHSGRTPSSYCQEERGGPCAYKTSPRCRVHATTTNTDRPHRVLTPDDANATPRPQLPRRPTQVSLLRSILGRCVISGTGPAPVPGSNVVTAAVVLRCQVM